MKKTISFIIRILLITLSLTLVGCSENSSQQVSNDNKITITDALGRQVQVSTNVNKVVAIGPGALRLYCYVGNIDKVAGVEQIEKDEPTGRPYILANPALSELDVIGPGGPNNSPDAEKILSVNPDVIFTTYAGEKSDNDELQQKTGIPVVSLSYGKSSVFDEEVYKSLNIIGTVMNNNERAEEVVEYMKKCSEDLNNRTKDIPESQKPKVYAGALSMKGAHGIESTQGNYALFNAINGVNVVDETEKTGSVMIDKEKLIEWNPHKIFIDYGGVSIVKDDYKKNPQYYNTLSAFNSGEVYLMQPYNFYTTNIDTAMTDAYYMGTVVYPEQFNDINPEEKADEIYNFLLGKSLYESISKYYGKFGRINL